jgi:hypothetical protein
MARLGWLMGRALESAKIKHTLGSQNNYRSGFFGRKNGSVNQ